MNQIKPTPVSKEVAARYPINIFLTYTKAGVRQHTLQSFPPGCTPATLATMMQTGLNDLGDVSPYGVRLLVRLSCFFQTCLVVRAWQPCLKPFTLRHKEPVRQVSFRSA